VFDSCLVSDIAAFRWLAGLESVGSLQASAHELRFIELDTPECQQPTRVESRPKLILSKGKIFELINAGLVLGVKVFNIYGSGRDSCPPALRS
jgi:hypothetical protein